eukprot:3940654-Rhodomonas_salina.2
MVCSPIILCTCYAMSGTDLAYAARGVWYSAPLAPYATGRCYGMCGTGLVYGLTSLLLSVLTLRIMLPASLVLLAVQLLDTIRGGPTSLRAYYAISGTDLAYDATSLLCDVQY